MLSHGEYNSTLPTLTVGKPTPLQLDVNGRLITSAQSGGVYNATPPTLTDGQRGDSQLDANGNTLVSQGTGLNSTDDEVSADPKGRTYKNMSASGVVSASPCKLMGMYVNSTSSGTIKFYDNASAGSGTVINNTITPAVGYHDLGGALTANGAYATIGGTLDVTIYTLPA